LLQFHTEDNVSVLQALDCSLNGSFCGQSKMNGNREMIRVTGWDEASTNTARRHTGTHIREPISKSVPLFMAYLNKPQSQTHSHRVCGLRRLDRRGERTLQPSRHCPHTLVRPEETK
jgi:type VI protein secretion system component Hcp